MANFQRIINMASKALDKSGNSARSGSGNTDWRDLVRTAADKVTGDSRPAPANPRSGTPRAAASAAPVSPEDRAAISRYNYLLKTAEPEQLEQVHREAFARLTPAQREQVEAQLREDLPANEQPASSNPDDLARSAVRGEAHNPGFLQKLFSKKRGSSAGTAALAGAGIGAAGGLLAAVAGGAVLSSVAGPLLEHAAGLGVNFEEFAGGFGELGLGDLASGAEEYTAGLGDQVSDFGSNLEIPGLSALNDLFGRN